MATTKNGSSSSTPATTVRFRDGRDGQFVKPSEAVRGNPDRYTRERVPTPGNGDTRKK